MKKIILSVIFYIASQQVFGQAFCENYCITIDDTICIKQLLIDTSGTLNNIWQTGRAHKPLVDTVIFNTKVIVTDTLNPYPAGNASAFIITNLTTYGDIYGFKMFTGKYFVKTDSLNDYGKIEFSADNGQTWIDIINDTIYGGYFQWYSQKPVLTGYSGNVKFFEVMLSEISTLYNINYGDTLLYRFSFYSDSIFDNLSGLLYDDICFWDFIEGISEIRFTPVKSKIYPNPANNNFVIEFDNNSEEPFQLSIYNINSKLISTEENITSNKIVIDASSYTKGVYVYKLTNLISKKRCWGKFVMN